MFKKFSSKESVTSHSQVKSSVIRGIRSKILEQYPSIEEQIDDILPKKTPLIVAKCQNHLNLIVVNDEIIFYNERDGPYFPSLRLLHKYPHMMIPVRVDTGAIKRVIGGANIMCPGLTSPGATLPEENIPENTPVAVMAEGKVHALAIGLLKMSTDEIKESKKGIGVDNIHYLGDGLWKSPNL
eukprot:TRINITY_DN1228_c0_g2_i1.p1 TRINITY_DN1228_c0_g2~~TRINITY_DN1228_c0_g2_i1.p1  ORF type:complete len:183 (-),score=35.80 TRINITY_DN1228_c0_g2_i1:318-866(-)